MRIKGMGIKAGKAGQVLEWVPSETGIAFRWVDPPEPTIESLQRQIEMLQSKDNGLFLCGE